MKRAGVALLIVWFFMNACGVMAAVKPTQSPIAATVSKDSTPVVTGSPLPSPTVPEVVASSPTPNPTSTTRMAA